MTKSAIAVRVACLLGLTADPVAADLLNHDLLAAHLERTLASVDPSRLTTAQREALYAPRASLMLSTLVPGWGTWRVEQRMFGGLRPAGVVLDWGVGGALPIGLAIAAFASDGSTRQWCAWSALALYAATRIGIQIIGNLHITEYNRRVGRFLSR